MPSLSNIENSEEFRVKIGKMRAGFWKIPSYGPSSPAMTLPIHQPRGHGVNGGWSWSSGNLPLRQSNCWHGWFSGGY